MDALSQLSYGPVDGGIYFVGRDLSRTFRSPEPLAPRKRTRKRRQNLIPFSARCFHHR